MKITPVKAIQEKKIVAVLSKGNPGIEKNELFP
jgi:hypothetical protein